MRGLFSGKESLHDSPEEDEEERTTFLKPSSNASHGRSGSRSSRVLLSDSTHTLRPQEQYTFLETSRLALEFFLLWFLANYVSAACLKYTTVASLTILTSTTGVWTLLFGSIMGVEKFSLKKLIGVLASLAGVALISTVDISSDDEDQGSFPQKTKGEIAIGDAMALLGAVIYGVYSIVMKKRIHDESRMSMPLFFGLVGLFSVVTLWPFFFILHFAGEETFQLPPTQRILTIVLVNSATSLISDMCWAYALLLTSPLVVTVGLSMTIPLSLVGQMVLDGRYESAWYWVGAVIVFGSFIVINHESKEEEEEREEAEAAQMGLAEEESLGLMEEGEGEGEGRFGSGEDSRGTGTAEERIWGCGDERQGRT